MAFCYPGHRHDALCDPALALPRKHPDPAIVAKGHAQFMREKNQDGWLAWQLSRPLTDVAERNRKMRSGSVPVKKKR
jgi:hypothetical protein